MVATRLKMAAALLVGLALLAEQTGPAAPAPFPRPGTVDAVAVLKTETSSRAAAVGRRLLSADFLDYALRDARARQLGCLRGVTNPRTWLKARLRTEQQENGKTLKVPLVNCPDRDALILLRTLVVGLTWKPAEVELRGALALFREYDRRLMQMRKLKRVVRNVITDKELAAAQAAGDKYDLEANPPTVQQVPHRVKAGR
jgi:hypothetical protein